MKLGTETVSIQNWMMASVNQPSPKVGDGVTICYWTDRRAGTIVKITPCTIAVQYDKAVRIDSNGMSEMQDYVYSADPDAPIVVFRKTKRGWRESGGGAFLHIGHREQYHDYSF